MYKTNNFESGRKSWNGFQSSSSKWFKNEPLKKSENHRRKKTNLCGRLAEFDWSILSDFLILADGSMVPT